MDRKRRLSWLLCLALAICFVIVSSLRFSEQRQLDRPAPPSVFADRLYLVGTFYSPFPSWVRGGLVRAAILLESSAEKRAFFAGQGVRALPDAAPVFDLMVSHRIEPSEHLREQLEMAASEAVLHLNKAFLTLVLVVGSCAVAAWMGSTGVAAPAPWVDSAVAVTLTLFFLWSLGSTVLTATLGPALSALTPVPRLLLVHCLSYALALCLLWGQGVRLVPRSWRRPPMAWLGRWYFLCLGGVFVSERLMTFFLGRPPVSSGSVWRLLSGASVAESLILIFLILVLGPLAEEIIFRGWLQGALNSSLGQGWSLLLSAALFALVHNNLESLPSLFVLGLLFGGIYQKTGTIWAPVLLHSLWNATALIALYASSPHLSDRLTQSF